MKNDVIKFLLGEGPLDGFWFGDKHPTEKGAFWWRKHLRQFIAQNQPNSGNTVLCGEGHNEAVIFHGDNTITNDQSQTTTLTAPNVLLATEAGTRLVSVCPHIDTKPLFGRMEQCLDCKEVLMIGG